MKLAVVVLDTLRRDAFEEYFADAPGVRFENAYSPSSWTVPVHGSLFAGGYPTQTGVHAGSKTLGVTRPVLAERLADAGYTTRAFSCNPYVSEWYDYDRGFDEFTLHHPLRAQDPDVINWAHFVHEARTPRPFRYLEALGRAVFSDADTAESIRVGLRMKARDFGFQRAVGLDDKGARSAVEYVDDTVFNENEFLFMNLMEAHSPYDPPEEYSTTDLKSSPNIEGTVLETDVDPEELHHAYDESVEYLADIYNKLFERLADDFDYVITLSDHGELFGEYGHWGHCHGLPPELNRIPLVLYDANPDDEANRTVSTPVSILDVYATVLDLAGVDVPDDSPSRSLLNVEARPVLAERFGFNREGFNNAEPAVRQAAEPYDRYLRGVATEDGYIYETIDGVESDGVSGPPSPDELDGYFEEIEPWDTDDDDVSVSDEVQQQLEELGYA